MRLFQQTMLVCFVGSVVFVIIYSRAPDPAAWWQNMNVHKRDYAHTFNKSSPISSKYATKAVNSIVNVTMPKNGTLAASNIKSQIGRAHV